jgi:hypothetical protein
VVRKVTLNLVPVALNANRIPDDAGGKFFGEVLKHSRWPQGIWIVSPDGKILAFHYFKTASGESPARGRERWVRETIEAIDAGLAAFGPVAPREVKWHDPLPDRGAGLLPDGGVRLAIFASYMRQGKRDGDPVVDSARLTEADWRAFAPPEGSASDGWDLPESALRKLAPALCPLTDSIYAPQPGDVKLAKLHARSEVTERGWTRIRYTGTLESQHNRDGDPKLPIRSKADIEGLGRFDPKARRLTSLLLVFHGEYRTIPPWDKPKPFAAAAEWHLAAPGSAVQE